MRNKDTSQSTPGSRFWGQIECQSFKRHNNIDFTNGHSHRTEIRTKCKMSAACQGKTDRAKLVESGVRETEIDWKRHSETDNNDRLEKETERRTEPVLERDRDRDTATETETQRQRQRHSDRDRDAETERQPVMKKSH